MLGTDLREGLAEDPPQLLAFQVPRRVISMALLGAFESGSIFVVTATRSATREVQTPMDDRPG